MADFGHFTGPVALFGGPYSNFQALEAFAAAIGDMPAVCTGDLVAYCAQPRETVDLFQQKGWPTIAGNCERQLAEDQDDCGCGFETGSTCDILSSGWWPYLRSKSDSGLRNWCAQLPDFGVFVADGRRYGVIHGGVDEINRFLWPSDSDDALTRELARFEEHAGPVDGLVAGHSGIAFQRRVGRHHWINAGAIGLPPHDGRLETRYAILEDGEVTIHRLSYDFAMAGEKMKAAGLTQGYDRAVVSGHWPSEDILPSGLRR